MEIETKEYWDGSKLTLLMLDEYGFQLRHKIAENRTKVLLELNTYPDKIVYKEGMDGKLIIGKAEMEHNEFFGLKLVTNEDQNLSCWDLRKLIKNTIYELYSYWC